MANSQPRNMVRARTPTGCVICELPIEGTLSTIQKSVGLGGRNLSPDVRTVQRLLNGVPATAGGPSIPLAEDGLVGPKTISAITAYQKRQLGWGDGRVDPDGPTLRRLQADNGEMTQGGGSPSGDGMGGQNRPGSAPRVNAQVRARTPQEAARIARAVAQIPRVREALNRALLRVDEAQHFAQHAGDTSLLPATRTMGEGAWLVFCKHYRLGFTQYTQGISAIDKVRNVLRSMKTIFARGTSVTGGAVWGAAIYDARPAPRNHPNWIAYAYIGGWHLGGRVDSGTREDSIYFCDGMDPKEDDMFLLTSVHELAHFVGDKPGGALPIVDQGYTDQPAYNQLGHWQRLTNADTYANFVGDFFLGTLRLEELNGPNLALLEDPFVSANGQVQRGKASGFPPNKRP